MEEYCLYLRKSRADAEAEARGEGETLTRHKRTLLELANRLQLNVTEIHQEVVSGETIAARPAMQTLLSEVEKGVWAGVLVMEVERLARGDTIDQGIVAQTFKFSDTKIITPVKIYDPANEYDEEYFEFGLFMSRREYKVINRRLQRGRIASVKEGKYVGSIPPYGYDKKSLDGEKGYILVPNQIQAPVVKLIFELYTLGEQKLNGTRERLGVSRIVRRLNGLKIEPMKGGNWSPATIRDMLINPVYIGKLRWNWRKDIKRREKGAVVVSRPRSSKKDCILVDGRHDPIIDQATFAIAQEYMSKNRPPAIRENRVVQNPLAGLVVCGTCGRKMQRRPYLSKGYPPSLLCPYTSCDNVSSALATVEKRILEALQDWLNNYQLQWNKQKPKSGSSIEVRKLTIKKLDAEIAMLQKQRENLHDLLEQGIYDTDTFLERTRVIAARAEQAENDRAALVAGMTLEEQLSISRKSITPNVEQLLAVYQALPTAKAKNDLLKDTLEKVVYIKEAGGRWADPDMFEIVIYPKIPHSMNSGASPHL
jgi:site-specific DNA recombinase